MESRIESARIKGRGEEENTPQNVDYSQGLCSCKVSFGQRCEGQRKKPRQGGDPGRGISKCKTPEALERSPGLCELRKGGGRWKSGQLPDHVGNANGGEGADSECEK